MMKIQSMLLASSSLLAACSSAGDRAGSGECPAGETCSDKTPDGLYFRSIGRANGVFPNDGPDVTAIGGTQTVRLFEKNGADDFPLAHAFTVSAAPSVTADVNSVDSVRLTGVAEGSNYLRIFDAEDGGLFDRINVEAAAVASAAIVPLHESPLLSFAYAEGSRVVVELKDASGRYVIDDTMSVTGGVREQWDTFALGEGPIGTRRLTVEAGNGAPINVDIQVTSPPNAIELQLSSLPIKESSLGRVCFEAKYNDTRVAGLPWTFTVDGQSVQAVEGSCVMVPTQTIGLRTVVAYVAGLTHTEEILVEQNGARAAAAEGATHADLADATNAAGERAAVVAAHR